MGTPGRTYLFQLWERKKHLLQNMNPLLHLLLLLLHYILRHSTYPETLNTMFIS